MKKKALELMEGYTTTAPRMKKVTFEPGKIIVHLQDGRIIISPLDKFPSIKKVRMERRKEYAIINNGTELNIFDCQEMYHVRDFVGFSENWLNQ